MSKEPSFYLPALLGQWFTETRVIVTERGYTYQRRVWRIGAVDGPGPSEWEDTVTVENV
jgi:hypothetical protein